MRYLLDTCVVSELRKAGDGKTAPSVTAWLNTVDAASFHISVVTVYELELGILQLLRKDRLQADRLRTWMNTFVLLELEVAHWPPTLPSRFVVRISMFQTRNHKMILGLLQPRWCTA